MKKVLLYLGKFPGYGFDIDGGSILARTLIDTLKKACTLDVVFIRKMGEIYEDPFVNSIKYVEYKDAFDNKFRRRLKNFANNQKALQNYIEYDVIVAAHVSKFFGFENYPIDFWKKTILFPMFCTTSYRRSGEIVPNEYLEQERIVMSHVHRIITPAETEKNDLINDYNVPANAITTIYRGINPLFLSNPHKQPSPNPQIVYIGSIKPQKNNKDAIVVLQRIIDAGIDAKLNLIGTIQDKVAYQNLLKEIDIRNLNGRVHFYHGLNQQKMAEILKKMSVNISVSNWETFGRGIFEGISAGLPTFVLSKLTSVKEICQENIGVYFADDTMQMADAIINILQNTDLYFKMSQALKTIADKVSYAEEKRKLLDSILI